MTPRPPLRGPGSEALRLIGYPAVREVLADLAARARRPSHLDREHALSASTFHRHAPELMAVGAISRRVERGPPRQVFYALGPSGRELCGLIEDWRALLPAAPGPPGTSKADWRAPIGLAEAWAAGLPQALFDGPRSLPQIEILVQPSRPGLTANQLRRLLANNSANGFFASEGRGREARFALAERGRYAVGELAAAARFERLHMGGAAIPITVSDVVGALRSHLPLLELPDAMEGVCEFTVSADPGQDTAIAMAWAQVSAGRVIASGQGPPPEPAATWARGTIEEWIAAVIEHRPAGIRAAGERPLGRAVIDALHAALYRRYGPSPPSGGARARACK
jgi:DNA-binding HxlR family transcriptional regulator